MVVLLPIVLLLFVVAVVSGETNLVVLLPTLGVLLAGVVVVRVAMGDGRPQKDPSVRTLPTDHLRRQMHKALRPRPSPRRRSGP